ncbi:hypothetical protein TNCT_677981 [Trichonephila clavata]|uniref:Uncharacterized protein n=1 Tax=Trichonephila clavata TaxID=2740835 RepID=A0A8X6KPX0_TRICU|nr:hypothetical protein TNCT_677981 [Trichonephila clavata]
MAFDESKALAVLTSRILSATSAGFSTVIGVMDAKIVCTDVGSCCRKSSSMSSFGTLCEAALRFIVLRSYEGFLSPSSSQVNNFRISSCEDSPVGWISCTLMGL